MRKETSFVSVAWLGKNFLTALTLFLLTTAFGFVKVQAQNDVITSPVEQNLEGTKEIKALFDLNSLEDNASFSANLITATTYNYSFLNGVALEDMSSGTTALVGASADDTASAVTNIGFDFWYDGVRFTQFSVNVNGLARLGSTVVGTTFNNSTDGLNTVTNAPKIAPYFEDLCTGSTGGIRSKVVGTAPNRKLIVEWFGMEIPREGSCSAAPQTGVFQMWLFESAGATTPGRIQFVYGGGIAPSTATDLGASVGLQSGAATNFASVTLTDDTVSYATANNTNLSGITSGKSYIFTPNVPNAPTGLSFAPVTQTSIQTNWTDNATNEFGYAIFRSLDGINYSFVAVTAADATSFNDTGLIPGTTYFYQVAAVSEGVISSNISGSQATNPAGTDTCAGAGGNWSDTATWADASVPTAADNVTIGSGCTVTVDTTGAFALNVTINSGGTLQSPSTGTVTNNQLTVGGNVTNNGTLDFSTNGDTSGAILTFVAPVQSVTFGGTGATTDVRAITVNKGSSAGTVELTTSNFTVLGVNTDTAGFLTLTSGTFKISGNFTITNRVFTTAAYSIPAVGGLWLNNPNFTVAGQNGSPTNNGLLRISNGTFNVGTSSGNSMGGGVGATFTIEGGTSNFAGRLQTTSQVNYNQSGGTVNVCTVGNTATTACFGLTATTNVFNMTGGTIVLVLPNTNATPLDYSVSTTATFLASPAGTTLQLGNMATPPATNFRITGATPNITINTGHTMSVGSGAAGAAIFFRGATFTNNGSVVIQGTGASSRFDWAANGPMTYTGTGTFGTAGTPFAGVGMSANSPNASNTTINSPIFVNRVNIFSGGFTNSNQITLGNAGTSTTVIQVGNSTTPTNSGTFDVSPVYNSGSGGHILLHLRTTTLNRTTGFEVNTARNLAQLTFDNNAVGATLNIAGGDLTISGAGAGALALTNGVVVVPPANTLFHNNIGTVTRTTGYVDGNLSRQFTATGAYTYHVGQNGYSPLLATVTALGMNPSNLAVKAVDNTLPGLNTAISVSRYWTLAETGDLTTDLAFTYLDGDINGLETDYRVFKLETGVITNQCMGGPCVNDATNTATITGVSSFSDWGIGENGASAPGVLAFSSATYSESEGNATATITVNRTGGSTGSVTADYTLSNGTATGGAACGGAVDFVNTGGTVTLGNGVTSQTFTVGICPDTNDEPDETVNMTLTNPTGGATIGMQNTAVLTIQDNDVAGTLQFSSATYSISETGPTATITVTRTGGSDGSVTADYATVAGGTATGGAACGGMVDYVNTSGTVTFGNGVTTSQTFTIPVCTDATAEASETVNLALTNATNGATLGTPNTAVLTITDVPPVAGNVTVNPGATNYATLKDAIDAINAGTHTGAVTVDINANTTETAPSVLNSSGAGAASYTSIIIRPSVDGVTVAGPTVTGRGLIELNGADNVTIDGDNPNSAGTNRNLTIQNTAANTVTFTSVIRVALNTTTVASADNNIFRNLNIVGSATGRNISTATSATGSENTTFGIVASSNASGATTAPTAISSVSLTVGTGATATNLTVSNNNITTAARGVVALGSATTVFPGLKIQNNTIGNPTAGAPNQIYNHGVSAQGSADGVISGNTVYVEGFVGSSGNAATVGIAVGVNSTNSTFTIEKNKINRVLNENPETWAVHGINLGGGNNHVVQNNFVSNLRNNQVAGTGAFSITFGLFGIRVGSGTGHKVYHNSVNLFGAIPGTVSSNLVAAFGIAGTGLTGCDVRNNIFVNTLTGGNPTGTRNVAVFLPSGGSAAMNLTLNNNGYFVGADAQNRLAQVGTTFGTGEFTLANFDPTMTTPATNFRSYTSTLSAAGTNDNASLKVDPLFVSNTDLHIQPTSPMLALGANLAVADDIDGDVRGATPDIGADELAAVAVPGSLQFSNATYSGGEAGSPFTVTVTRTGGSDGTVTVDYATSNGTATGGAACGGAVDYVNASGTLTFLNGETSKTFNVTICNDTTDEPDETINYALTNATGGATIGSPSTAVQTIVDDDVPAMNYNVAISDARITEGNMGTANMTFNVTLTSAMTSNLGSIIASVQYATANGTATSGSDYTTTTGTLNFNSTGTLTVNVPIAGDTTKESNEFFFVNLSMPSMNTTITDNQGAGIIVDNDRPYVADFDRDLKADYSVFRPGTLIWYALQSSNGVPQINAAGALNGVPVPGDYDGDGKIDSAVFQASSGVWSVLRSSNNSIQTTFWGTAGDKPVQGDYDGDGKTDLAVFRPSTGTWWILRSSDSNSYAVPFGLSTDKPMQGDYDGDFKTDVAVYRDGTWFVLRSSTNTVSISNWGNATDKPVSGDFDGDGRNDLAIYRNGVWWIINSLSGTSSVIPFGLATDIPAPADFDGDGSTDIAVYRGAGNWFVLQSSNQAITGVNWGLAGDVPVPAAYIPQ